MADRNEVVLEGALTAQVKISYTTKGQAVTKLNLITKATVQGREIPNYHDVVAWGESMAATLSALDAGSRVYIEGRLVKRSYEGKDGKKVYVVEVVAQTVTPIGQALATPPTEDEDIPF